MNNANHLHLRFVGNAITPEVVRARDLADALAAFESAIAAVAAQSMPGTKADQFTIALVQIHAASLGLEFAAPLESPVLAAATQLVTTIEAQNWGALPNAALQGVRGLVTFNKRYACTAHLQTRHARRTTAAILTADTVIPAAADIYGETELVGQVRRVGGREPKVEFRTIQGETLYCETTQALAKQLGNYLYDEVQVAGVATWNARTYAITDFEITRLVGPINQSPLQAFQYLRDQFGDAFAEVDDVDAWVQEQRNG